MRPLRQIVANYKFIFALNEEKKLMLEKYLHGAFVLNIEDILDIGKIDIPLRPGTECLQHHVDRFPDLCPHASAYRVARWCCKNYNAVNLILPSV